MPLETNNKLFIQISSKGKTPNLGKILEIFMTFSEMLMCKYDVLLENSICVYFTFMCFSVFHHL